MIRRGRYRERSAYSGGAFVGSSTAYPIRAIITNFVMACAAAGHGISKPRRAASAFLTINNIVFLPLKWTSLINTGLPRQIGKAHIYSGPANLEVAPACSVCGAGQNEARGCITGHKDILRLNAAPEYIQINGREGSNKI